MDILSVMGNIASIVGLSKQVIDDFAKIHPNPVGKAMGALKALSITGKTWKDIHAKYHALERMAPRVLAAIETIENGQRVSKALNKINANDLRLAFDEADWAMVLENFVNDLEPYIDSMSYANNLATKEKVNVLENLRKAGHYDIAEKIQKIVNAQEKIVTIHFEVKTILSQIKQFVEEDKWQPDQIEYILKQRSVFRVRLPSLIGSADAALMALLDLYNLVIDSV